VSAHAAAAPAPHSSAASRRAAACVLVFAAAIVSRRRSCPRSRGRFRSGSRCRRATILIVFPIGKNHVCRCRMGASQVGCLGHVSCSDRWHDCRCTTSTGTWRDHSRNYRRRPTSPRSTRTRWRSGRCAPRRRHRTRHALGASASDGSPPPLVLPLGVLPVQAGHLVAQTWRAS